MSLKEKEKTMIEKALGISVIDGMTYIIEHQGLGLPELVVLRNFDGPK
jgi:hypothetical protein